MKSVDYYRLVLKAELFKGVLEELEAKLGTLRFDSVDFDSLYKAYQKMVRSPRVGNSYHVNVKPDEREALLQVFSGRAEVLVPQSDEYDRVYALYLKLKESKGYAHPQQKQFAPASAGE